jgi:AraC-like DNA-binding protein
MKKSILIFYIFLFCNVGCVFLFAQTDKAFIIPDSLKKISFKKLEENYQKSLLNTQLRALYSNTYYIRSKTQKDIHIIANGMCMKAFQYKNDDVTLKYLDSVTDITKNNIDFEYPAKGYILKSKMFYSSDKLHDALKNILIAQQFSKQTNNIEQSILIKQQIGLINIELGKPQEALPLILENYNYYLSNKKNDPYHIYSGWILSDIYNRLKRPNEALFYIDYFLKNLDSNNMYYRYFLLNKGVSCYLKKDYTKSILLLGNSTNLIKQTDDPLNLAIGYYYLGENQLKQNTNNTVKAKYYFEKVDSILVATKKKSGDFRDNYIRLIDIAKKENDNKKQLYYLNRLIEIDNYLNKNNIKLSESINKNYTTPNLFAEKEETINKISREKYIYIAAGSLIFVGLGISLFFLIKNRKQKQILQERFEKLMLEPKHNENINNSKGLVANAKTIDLSKEIINDILEKLLLFENNKNYLDPNIRQIDLAKKFDTNSSYLSKVINSEKGKNFSQYINDLRIDYTIIKLKEDKKFRKYSIESISEEVGYNNPKAFSKAFYERIAVKPSVFIKSI